LQANSPSTAELAAGCAVFPKEQPSFVAFLAEVMIVPILPENGAFLAKKRVSRESL
jgi:hypothetical protein